MLDADGRISNWNAGAKRPFGYREEEAVGEPGSLLFTPEDVRSGVPDQELKKAAEEGRAEDECWHARKDGSPFWSSGLVRPVRSEDGILRGFVKVARDVTDRKRAEETLQFLAEASDVLSSSLDYHAVEHGAPSGSKLGRLVRCGRRCRGRVGREAGRSPP